MEQYPNIQIVSRDGSRTYAAAIAGAHPQAVQISDRFHLLKNLTDHARLALQRIFQGRIAIPVTEEIRRHRMIMLVGTIAQKIELVKGLRKSGYSQDDIRLITGASERTIKKYVDMREEDIPDVKQTVRGHEHAEAVKKQQNRAELVHALRNDGLSITQISQKTGFTYQTVHNYLSATFSPVNAHYGGQREGKLASFHDEVLRLKSVGWKYREIYAAIKDKGYAGTQDAIRGFISKERRIRQDLLQTGAGTQELIPKKWLIRLLYKPIEEIKGLSVDQLEYVFSVYPDYKNILGTVNDFRTLFKSKNPEALLPWIEKTASYGIPELNPFIESLKRDIDAVMNAVVYDYNNGLAEGSINKIKLIKRIMYGRCKFPMLKNKCLLISFFE